MVPITALWLPILVSAVFVFVLSSLVHMVFKYHASDYRKLPDEDAIAEALRKFTIPDGTYQIPRAGSMEELRSPAHMEKVKKGPNAMMTFWSGGSMGMTGELVQWFVYSVLIGILTAYIAGRALGPGAHYLAVFRFAGATAFIAYAVAGWQESIWFKRPWSTTLKNTFDGLLYALVTAGTFGWLWPVE